jgi:hypothetical protein
MSGSWPNVNTPNRAPFARKVKTISRISGLTVNGTPVLRRGANAVVGIDIDYETVGANASMLMVTVSGTAVVLQ